MPRIGRHPLKGTADIPQHVNNLSIITIVYIPVLSGYWQEGLDVLKLFFISLYQNTKIPFDLMVFDNGSCREVQNFLIELKNSGKIQYLILSQNNLRKTGALNYLLSAAQGEYVAYADSDVYFLPGWLENSLEVLSVFPEAGKVTALPIVMDTSSGLFESIFSGALISATNDPSITIETGTLVSDNLLNAHCLSLGESSEQYRLRINQRRDILLKRMECEVLLSGADVQFTIRRDAIKAVLPLQVETPEEQGDSIYSPVLEFRLAQHGFWQLSTPGYYIHHMGNHVPDFKSELPWLDPSIFSATQMNEHQPILKAKTSNLPHKFVDRLRKSRPVRRLLKRIHLLSYRLLYER